MAGAPMPHCRMPRFRLRKVFVAMTLASVVMAYAGAYYRLSRRGMEEAAVYGLPGFFYVSAEEVMTTEDLSTQRRWCLFFAPANWVDQCVFGGPAPIQDIMFRLS
jgi:hypothetical protein